MGASTPGYRLLCLVASVFMGAALFGMKHRQNRAIGAISFALIAAFGFSIATFQWSAAAGEPRLLMLASFPLVLLACLRIYMVEAAEA